MFRTELIRKYGFIFFFALALIIAGCSEDSTNEPQVNESEVVLQYMEANGDFINTGAPAMITAQALKEKITGDSLKTYVLDIRKAEDFAKGHIGGAVNITLADLRSHLNSINASSYTTIAVACYSGQTASYGVSLMRLLGMTNIYALKWGMSSWHDDFAATWNSKIGNSRAAQFVTETTDKAAKTTLPTINTGKTTGREILEVRVDTLLKRGFTEASISNDAVFTELSKYYIVNYWTEAQYKDPGHVPGASNYIPKTDLKSTTNILTLPTTKPIVFYCYTGQTSSFVSAYLRVLGYDCKSLLFGGNAMIYDLMKGKAGFTVWDATKEVMNYPYVK